MSPLLISFPSTLCTHLCTHSACWIVFLVPVYCPYLGEFTYNPILPSMSSSYLFWKLPPIISGASLSFGLTWRSCCMKHWKHDPTTATRQHGGTQKTSSPEPSPLCLTRNKYERSERFRSPPSLDDRRAVGVIVRVYDWAELCQSCTLTLHKRTVRWFPFGQTRRHRNAI